MHEYCLTYSESLSCCQASLGCVVTHNAFSALFCFWPAWWRTLGISLPCLCPDTICGLHGCPDGRKYLCSSPCKNTCRWHIHIIFRHFSPYSNITYNQVNIWARQMLCKNNLSYMIYICACCVDRLIYIYLLIPEGNFWHVIIIRQRPGMNPEDVVIFLTSVISRWGAHDYPAESLFLLLNVVARCCWLRHRIFN